VPLRDGTSLWTMTTGSGPPMVFCHGGPGLWDYLGPLAALVDDRVTAIRFEQRGCARSGGGDGPFTIAQAVADLDDLRAALGVEQWYLLGHSWGAELALRYAAHHPDRTLAVLYIAGVGAGQGFYPGFEAEVRRRRSGADHARWQELGARERSPEEEHEWCLLRWRPDFSRAVDPM
jgi:proline iminopeptidase